MRPTEEGIDISTLDFRYAELLRLREHVRWLEALYSKATKSRYRSPRSSLQARAVESHSRSRAGSKLQYRTPLSNRHATEDKV
jgi:hypothetical protein